MTNTLVGDVYAKIIDEVVKQSTADFEESGISQSTLQSLQQEWQAKLSLRNPAHMPWDPKPIVQQPPAPAPTTTAPAASSSNGAPQNPPSYNTAPYADTSATNPPTNGNRIKAEPGTEPQVTAPSNGYAQNNGPPPQGGLARAQQLIHNQYGNAANASLNAMQQRGGGLALPGQQQQQQQNRPQGLQLPQQTEPVIKKENDGSQVSNGQYQQTAPLPNYSQTDGADEADYDTAMEQWKAMLAERRAISDEVRQQADHMMRDHAMQINANLSSGLMVPLEEHRTARNLSRGNAPVASSSRSAAGGLPTIPQLDGEVDDEDEEKPDIKDEDDENAINSDLDDTDDEGKGMIGEDDDEDGDEILCTYDKVQRVKNKWKCTLKDGIMSAGGKDWTFHKATGEFEW